MDSLCPRCDRDPGANTFCQCCGKLVDRPRLQGVQLLGAIGVMHSSSPKIEEFYRTGDPEVFDRV